MQETPVGELQLKFMIKKEVIYTRATASHLRENLTNLETNTTTVNYKVNTFNQHVKLKVEGLKARGERKY